MESSAQRISGASARASTQRRSGGAGAAAVFSKRLGAAAAGYLRSRHGGAMLVASTFVLIIMSTVGGMAMDYAWREAQWAEIRSATRAAIASAGQLLDDPEAKPGGDPGGRRGVRHGRGRGVRGGSRRRRRRLRQRHELDHGGGPRPVRLRPHLGRRGASRRTSRPGSGWRSPARAARGRPSPWTSPVPCGSGFRAAAGRSRRSWTRSTDWKRFFAADRSSYAVAIVPFGSAVNAADTCYLNPDTGDCAPYRDGVNR